jgi:predicted nucleic acid-binding protein
MILTRCETGDRDWIRSAVADSEIGQTPDPERRRRVRSLAAHARRSVAISQSEIERAQQLEVWGFSAFDALHLAAAESGGADVFLTTDDNLLRRSQTHSRDLRVRVENPLTWLREVS